MSAAVSLSAPGYEVRDEAGNLLGSFDCHLRARRFAKTVRTGLRIHGPSGEVLGDRAASRRSTQSDGSFARGSDNTTGGVIGDFDL